MNDNAVMLSCYVLKWTDFPPNQQNSFITLTSVKTRYIFFCVIEKMIFYVILKCICGSEWRPMLFDYQDSLKYILLCSVGEKK